MVSSQLAVDSFKKTEEKDCQLSIMSDNKSDTVGDKVNEKQEESPVTESACETKPSEDNSTSVSPSPMDVDRPATDGDNEASGSSERIPAEQENGAGEISQLNRDQGPEQHPQTEVAAPEATSPEVGTKEDGDSGANQEGEEINPSPTSMKKEAFSEQTDSPKQPGDATEPVSKSSSSADPATVDSTQVDAPTKEADGTKQEVKQDSTDASEDKGPTDESDSRQLEVASNDEPPDEQATGPLALQPPQAAKQPSTLTSNEEPQTDSQGGSPMKEDRSSPQTDASTRVTTPDTSNDNVVQPGNATTTDSQEKVHAQKITAVEESLTPMDVDTPADADKIQVGQAKEAAPATLPAVPLVPETMPKDPPSGNEATHLEAQKASSTGEHEEQEMEQTEPPSPREVPQWVVESESEDEEDGTDPFEAFKQVAGDKASKISRKRIEVKIVSIVSESENEEKKEGKKVTQESHTYQSSTIKQTEEEEMERFEMELQDSLLFFQEPHEDQDPDFASFERAQSEKQVAVALQKLEEEDKAERAAIESIVADQLKEKQSSTQHSYEKYKERTVGEGKAEMALLQKKYSEKVNSNQQKINHGVQVLSKRQSAEQQKVLDHHQQQVQQRRTPQQLARAEWENLSQRLRAKHRQQQQEFEAKGEEVKKRTEAEYKREQDIVRKKYEKRLRDLEANRQNLYNRMYAGFQQLRQRYLKRHMQKVAKQKELLSKSTHKDAHDPGKEEIAGKTKVSTKSAIEDKLELRPPSPIMTCDDWFKNAEYSKSGAAARHKHRKGALGQLAKQLSVEIHNEGIWVALLQERKDDNDKKKKGSTTPKEPHVAKKQFVPWGLQARDFLHNIICGEIPAELGPDGYDFDFSDTSAANGGHLRCVLTDLRTSDETASSQRSTALVEQEKAEVTALENKVRELQGVVANSRRAHAQCEKVELERKAKVQAAMQRYEARKQILLKFRNKFSQFLGPEDIPLPQTKESDRKKLLQASQKYKSDLAVDTQKAKDAQASLAEAKAATQQQASALKQREQAVAMATNNMKKKKALLMAKPPGRQEPENISSRVSHLVNALGLTADTRMDQLIRKRNSTTSSSWVQALPGVPGPLRKSLWYKVHRRRQQIVLRPSLESLEAELRRSVSKKLDAGATKPMSSEEMDGVMQKAEQAFLLAVHPMFPSEEPPTSVPTSSSWGEPGWHVKLDVPRGRTKSLLPRAHTAPLVHTNLSELLSAPGRQAAALSTATHLRSLTFPLSTVATATSLAETNPIAPISTAQVSENDPLQVSDKELELAYTFSLKFPQVKPTPVSRRKVPAGKDLTQAVARTGGKKATQSSAQSALTASNQKATDTASSPPGKASRKRKPSVDATARATQRRKASSKPTVAQARAMQQQLQRQQQQQQQQQQQFQRQQQPSNQSAEQGMLPSRSSFSGQQSMVGMDPQQQQQQNQYNQFMKPMPSSASQPPQQRTSYQQQLYQQQQQQQQQQPPQPQQQQQQFQPPQMPQLRMMQQQQQAPQQVQYGQSSRGMQQQMNQFFPPMQQQQFAPQPMGMSGQVPGGMQMNMQGNNPGVRQGGQNGEDQNDPLYMLQDM